MKIKNLSLIVSLLICLLCAIPGFSQDYNLKQEVNADEIAFLQKIAKEISVSDQIYRNYLAKGTLDENIIKKIDAAFDSLSIEEAMVYERSLNLSLDERVEDSLWQLQHAIDLQNHLTLKGIWDTYGFLSKEILGDKEYVQLLVLMHPPKDWDVREYLEEYSQMFLEEVHAGRMPAKTYATFYDNIKGKILREPQLYGTNMQFDSKTNTVKPPMIEDLVRSNEARKKIGMPMLADGEYRLKGE